MRVASAGFRKTDLGSIHRRTTRAGLVSVGRRFRRSAMLGPAAVRRSGPAVMNSPTLTTDLVVRPPRGRVALAPPAATLNPLRTAPAAVPRDPGARSDDEDLGPWVRLPGGGLELQIWGEG